MEHRVEHGAPDQVETGVRLVQEQEPGVAGQGDPQREAPALAGGEVAVSDRGEPGEVELLEETCRCRRVARGSCRERDVLGHGEVVVAERVGADEGEIAPMRAGIGCEVVAEHGGGAGAQRDQAGEQSQERRLTGAVGARDQHDLTGGDVEVDTREGGEPSEQADGGAKRDDEGHDLSPVEALRGPVGRREVYEAVAEPGEPSGTEALVGAGTLPGVRTAIGALGRVLITVGLLILLFVAYQLWGTGIYTARAQHQLERDFDEQLQAASTTATPPLVAPPPPPEGDAAARIRIPEIDVDWIVVNGVQTADLKKGPGHYPETPMPGELGNAAIAGHRTTYGAPFHRLDELAAGDEIEVTTLAGTYTYVLADNPFVVAPSAVEVLLPEPEVAPDGTSTGQFKAQLTLTTCNPKYSAAQRLVVKATLDADASPEPRPATTTPTEELGLDAGLSGDDASLRPAVLWGAIVVLVGALWWFLFHRYPRWTTWFAGVIPFLVTLFFFYTYLERLLPANY